MSRILLQNYYKQFRTGYLSEGNLSVKLQQAIDWLLNQMNDEVKTKLQQYCPALIKEVEQKIFQANEQRHYRDYRACQNSLKAGHHLLIEIKNSLKTIDQYENTLETYAKIENQLLIHTSIQLPTVKLFQQYLDKITTAIAARTLEKAKLFINICVGDLAENLQKRTVNDTKASQLTQRIEDYLQVLKNTHDWAKSVSNSLDWPMVEKILSVIQSFVGEQKYILADRLLDDLLAQLSPRIVFWETWQQYQQLFPNQVKTQETPLSMALQQSAWEGATHFLQEKMSSTVNTAIQNIVLY